MGRGGEGRSTVQHHPLLGLVKEGIPAVFLLWDPAGCLGLRLRPLLLGGKGSHVRVQGMVGCSVSQKG